MDTTIKLKNHNKPNLFIVGAAKSGTTSVASYLEKHSKIFISPIKEPHYFSKDITPEEFTQKIAKDSLFDMDEYLSNETLEKKHINFIKNIEDYLSLYRDVDNEIIIGEASTGYLFSKESAKEIYKFNPNSKIIIILRDPVQRAYSHWKMNLASGVEDNKSPFIETMEKDFLAENKGFCKNHLYLDIGLYSEDVTRYINIFPRDNIKIILFEELVKNTEQVIVEILFFLNLESLDIDYSVKKNVSKRIKYAWMHKLNSKIKLTKFIPKKLLTVVKDLFVTESFPELRREDEKYLYENYFKEDVSSLEKILNVNLQEWKY